MSGNPNPMVPVGRPDASSRRRLSRGSTRNSRPVSPSTMRTVLSRSTATPSGPASPVATRNGEGAGSGRCTPRSRPRAATQPAEPAGRGGRAAGRRRVGDGGEAPREGGAVGGFGQRDRRRGGGLGEERPEHARGLVGPPHIPLGEVGDVDRAVGG